MITISIWGLLLLLVLWGTAWCMFGRLLRRDAIQRAREEGVQAGKDSQKEMDRLERARLRHDAARSSDPRPDSVGNARISEIRFRL